MWLFQRPLFVDRWRLEKGVSNANDPAGYLQAQLLRMPFSLSKFLLLEKISLQISRIAKSQENCGPTAPHLLLLEPWRHDRKYLALIEALRPVPNSLLKSLPTTYSAENRQATKKSAGQTLFSKDEEEI